MPCPWCERADANRVSLCSDHAATYVAGYACRIGGIFDSSIRGDRNVDQTAAERSDDFGAAVQRDTCVQDGRLDDKSFEEKLALERRGDVCDEGQRFAGDRFQFIWGVQIQMTIGERRSNDGLT